MILPLLNEIKRERESVTAFGGINRRSDAGLNTIYDMCDFSSDGYPLLSTREKRGKLTVTPASGLFSENGIIRFSGDEIQDIAEVQGRVVFCTKTKVYVDSAAVNGLTLTDISPLKHRIAVYGRNFFIYPDGIYFDKSRNNTYTVKRAKYTISPLTAIVSLSFSDGTAVSAASTGEDYPSSPAEGDSFLRIDDDGAYYCVYTGGGWSAGVKVCLKISGAGMGQYAYIGEETYIKGLCSDTVKGQITAFDTGYVIVDKDGAIPQNILDSGGTRSYSSLKLFRTMPEVDFVCEHGNRLWACRYGDDGNGNFVNEIYASKQGNPLEWNSVSGISTDSYTVSLGCSGEFTGVCAFGGEIVFFKEETIIRISGSNPSEFYVQSVPARGVAKGCDRTLVILNEKAFYKSVWGVAVYDGALPYLISEALEGIEYTAECACGLRGKYRLKIKENGENFILVYDTENGLWHRESDRENTCFFAKAGGCVFMICKSEKPSQSGCNEYTVWAIVSAQTEAFDIFRFTDIASAEYTYTEEALDWWVQTGNACEKYNGTGFIRSLSFRVQGDTKTRFSAAIRCNAEEKFREIFSDYKINRELVTLRVNTPRCDSFELKITGSGNFVLHSLSIVSEPASEVSAVEYR